MKRLCYLLSAVTSLRAASAKVSAAVGALAEVPGASLEALIPGGGVGSISGHRPAYVFVCLECS